MKRHSSFEQVPRGLRFIAIRETMTTDQGLWVPVPIFWIVHTWRKLYLAYLRWSLNRTMRGRTIGKTVIVCLQCGAHNTDDPDFDPLHCWNCDNVLERES